MNVGAPTCGACGGLNTNPQSNQCRFCGQMLQQAYPPQGGYGAPPPGMPAGYGPPPGGGYGGPQPYNPYGAPNPYGGPAPNPYAPQYPVQGFGGVQPFNAGQNVYVNRSGWSSGWSTFFWIRLGIALIVVFFSLMGACVSAISH